MVWSFAVAALAVGLMQGVFAGSAVHPESGDPAPRDQSEQALLLQYEQLRWLPAEDAWEGMLPAGAQHAALGSRTGSLESAIRWPAGTTVEAHKREHPAIGLVLSGTVALRTSLGDPDKIAGPWTVFWVPPDVAYALTCEGGQDCVIYSYQAGTRTLAEGMTRAGTQGKAGVFIIELGRATWERIPHSPGRRGRVGQGPPFLTEFFLTNEPFSLFQWPAGEAIPVNRFGGLTGRSRGVVLRGSLQVAQAPGQGKELGPGSYFELPADAACVMRCVTSECVFVGSPLDLFAPPGATIQR